MSSAPHCRQECYTPGPPWHLSGSCPSVDGSDWRPEKTHVGGVNDLWEVAYAMAKKTVEARTRFSMALMKKSREELETLAKETA